MAQPTLRRAVLSLQAFPGLIGGREEVDGRWCYPVRKLNKGVMVLGVKALSFQSCVRILILHMSSGQTKSRKPELASPSFSLFSLSLFLGGGRTKKQVQRESVSATSTPSVSIEFHPLPPIKVNFESADSLVLDLRLKDYKTCPSGCN